MATWYNLENVDQLDSPALVIYTARVAENIQRLIHSIDDITRLRPHVKTHKSAEITRMLLDTGITKFKCATIAEAEMLASAGVPDVLLAYQPIGPKAKRVAELSMAYGNTRFSCLIDHAKTAQDLSEIFLDKNRYTNVYIDVNVGMNRTGIVPSEAYALWETCQSFAGINIAGLHVYDGHLRDPDFQVRTRQCDAAFAEVETLQKNINLKSKTALEIVAGGTPTYPIHAKRQNIECSPGTFIYWDKGYQQILPEQDYLHAAVVISRVISKPTADSICVDLGHKSIAAENPLPLRVHFLNAPDAEPIGQSEEHLVLKIKPPDQFNVGDVLYGIPYHVCPTVALYDRTAVAEGNKIIGYWNTLSRNRMISI
ncbi:MAG TPA: D-TA family PLP-dependent enzyme [Ohtaekwangia sp.]|nr:D-TA family PLP-dependent enzyme [Ohtaekwangia sp.]